MKWKNAFISTGEVGAAKPFLPLNILCGIVDLCAMNKNNKLMTFKHLFFLVKEDNYMYKHNNLKFGKPLPKVLPVLFVTTLYESFLTSTS